MQLLLNEPRGFYRFKWMYRRSFYSSEIDAAVLFFNHEGSIPLHYGGIVAVLNDVTRKRIFKKRERRINTKIETLSGIFLVHAYVENDEVVSVSFESKVCYMIEKNFTS